MRIALPAIIAAASILAACGGSSKSATTTPPASASTPRAATSTRPPASPTKAGTPGATATRVPSGGDAVELTGIVGSITPGTRTIEVTRLSGATVNQIEVQDSTRIRKAEGGSETFAQVRTSDRVIASGHLNDRGDALVADDITVQSGVPGAQPGG